MGVGGWVGKDIFERGVRRVLRRRRSKGRGSGRFPKRGIAGLRLRGCGLDGRFLRSGGGRGEGGR